MTDVHVSCASRLGQVSWAYFNVDWITSVCTCMSDRERSTRTSFTHTKKEEPVLGHVLVLVSVWMQPHERVSGVCILVVAA